MDYIYGIAWHTETAQNNYGGEGEPSRTNMTLEEAEDFIKEWIEDGGRPDAFRIVRRPVSPWEEID